MNKQNYPLLLLLILLLAEQSCSTPLEKQSFSVHEDNVPLVSKEYAKEFLREIALRARQVFPDDSLIIDFYSNRKNLIWFAPDSSPISNIAGVQQKISQSLSYGISPDKFIPIDTTDILIKELYLTHNYQTFGKAISRKDSATKDTNWLAILEYGKQNGSIFKELLSLQPKNAEYQRLQKGLEQYLENVQLNDSVIQVPNFKKDSLKSYLLAQKALYLHGFLPTPKNNDSAKIISALKTFQYQHGLETDAIIGKATAKELSKSTNYFYYQAQKSLEKWRKTKDFEPNHIFVNIATYKLKIYNNQQLDTEHKIVVGTPAKRTPELDSWLNYMIIYPYWYVPKSIVTEELTPKVLKDSTYLNRNGYEVLSGKKVIHLSSSKFSHLSSYRIRQKGGRGNALGKIKFHLQNKFSVYFHDTPSKRFFKKGRRAYSHGCMRVDHPLELADYLLQHDSANTYTIDSVNYYIKNKTRKVITFKRKTPIHIRYFTVEADSLNTIRFYPDVYGNLKNLEYTY